MNYAAIYDRLIDRARTRVLTEYSESHHIIPRCMGGTNKAENRVRLTAEEHFVAHQLLVQMYPENGKIVFALLAMCRNMQGKRPNNKMFGWMRRRVAVEIGRMKKGVPRPRWIMEKMWSISRGSKAPPERKAKMSAAMSGRKHTAEHNAAVSAANMGRKGTMTGRTHSAETKAKMRATALGRKHTPETIARLTEFAANSTQEQRSARAHKAWQTKHMKLVNMEDIFDAR